MLRAGAGAGVTQNFCMRRHEATQGLRIFVVYRRDFIAAEIAVLFDNRLVVSLLRSHENLK